MTEMVIVEDLHKSFGPVAAVDGLSFCASKGEVLGILGPNGAGKSTTMKMITGFLKADAGRIIVDGNDISEKPVAVKKNLGYLPEGAPLYSDMSVAAFLLFISGIRGYHGLSAGQRVEEIVDQMNLQTVFRQPIDTLSKGFKRRVGLAQALLHDPKVLVLDEPTDGLDPNQKHEVRKLIRTLAKNKTIILSTHLLEEVHAVCDRNLIITDGAIVADGTPGELEARSRYHNAVFIRLSGCDPDIAESRLSAVEGVDSIQHEKFYDQENGQQCSFYIFPINGVPIVASIFQMAREEQWLVQELRVEKGRLDEVFRKLTTKVREGDQ